VLDADLGEIYSLLQVGDVGLVTGDHCQTRSVRRAASPRGRRGCCGYWCEQKERTWQADCNVARPGALLLMDKADLTIIVQRSLMDRYGQSARHHLPDLQGRQRRVQLPENRKVVEHRLDHGIDQLIRLITR
jgi:hypothetical protein